MEFIKNIYNYFKNLPFSSSGKLENLSNFAQNSETVQNINSVVNILFKYGAIIAFICALIWVIKEFDILTKIYEGFMTIFWGILLVAVFIIAMS